MPFASSWCRAWFAMALTLTSREPCWHGVMWKQKAWLCSPLLRLWIFVGWLATIKSGHLRHHWGHLRHRHLNENDVFAFWTSVPGGGTLIHSLSTAAILSGTLLTALSILIAAVPIALPLVLQVGIWQRMTYECSHQVLSCWHACLSLISSLLGRWPWPLEPTVWPQLLGRLLGRVMGISTQSLVV